MDDIGVYEGVVVGIPTIVLAAVTVWRKRLKAIGRLFLAAMRAIDREFTPNGGSASVDRIEHIENDLADFKRQHEEDGQITNTALANIMGELKKGSAKFDAGDKRMGRIEQSVSQIVTALIGKALNSNHDDKEPEDD